MLIKGIGYFLFTILTKMAVKIRLQRHGRKKRPFYHIVVADARARRDGKFIEKLGTYNPMTKPATIEIDRERAFQWLMNGAQPTDTARAILRLKGVLYKKHLQRGVTKGALTQEEADAKYKEWIDTKDAKLAERFRKSAEAKRKQLAEMAGVAPVTPEKPIVEEDIVSKEEEVVTETTTEETTETEEQQEVEEQTEVEAVVETERED